MTTIAQALKCLPRECHGRVRQLFLEYPEVDRLFVIDVFLSGMMAGVDAAAREIEEEGEV